MAQLNPKHGQTIQTQDGRQGIVRYSGPLHIAAGDWLGLELPDDSGKNDGSVKGERYFQCSPGYGIFVRKESVVKIVKQAAPPPRTNGSTPTPNGNAIKPRPSGVMPPDVARKRQSLMSQGSGTTTGSRLSVRSPTKSPTKAVSSASSAASTPRTMTPATTARTSDSSTKSRLSATGRTSMGPPTAPAKPASSAPRPLAGAVSRTAPRPSSTTSRQSLSGSRSSLPPKPTPQPARRGTQPPREERIRSPTIEEEEQDEEMQNLDTRLQEPEQTEDLSSLHHEPEPEPASPTTSRSGAVSAPRTTAANVEARTADRRENEQLKAKLRTLEKKLMENRDLRKNYEQLQEEKGKYDRIIETMKNKIKNNVQEMADLKAKVEDAEKRAGEDSSRSAEHESELELATLDKDMAEERAELYRAELEALKLKHEELELESEIIREENRELGSVMSPEDRANAGWMQMEKEQERLRQALILLRDMSQQSESDLKGEIKELQGTLDELDGTASKYNEVSEKLAKTQETNKHLMEQLEVAEANDDVVIAMEAQREQSTSTIEQLRRQIQEFEEHIQVTDELELFHVEEEKRLHYQLDETEAQFNDKQRQTTEQEKVIEDLEYTLTKFRDVVSGLQNDINELRRSRDISEVEAHEMSSKSRAMMDLNLQLQNSANKTQLKTIDYEMGRMHAEQAQAHLDIMQLFVAEGFERERNPVLALLCFKRIKSKASLTKGLLSERMKDRAHLADDPFMVYEVMEKMGQFVTLCERSMQFMSSCSPDDFAKYSGALHELEPVERSMTMWVESLKRDELSNDGPEPLKRMIGILQDINEKLITESGESKATELITQARMVETYADSAAIQLSAFIKEIQARLGGPKEDDEESHEFDKRMDQFATKARTIKYLGGKVTQLLLDLRSGSMCLGETSWVFFEETEAAAANVATLIREIGKAIINEFAKLDHDEPLTYHSITSLMNTASKQTIQLLDPRAQPIDDVYTLLTALLSSLQSKVDDLQSKSSEISSAIEFEKHAAPWTIRAKEIRQQKVVSLDTQQELTRLQTKAAEQVRILAEREKVVEELNIKVELLERRNREASANTKDVKALSVQLEAAKAEKDSLLTDLETTKSEFETLLKKRTDEHSELENLRSAALNNADASAIVIGGENSETAKILRVDVECLKAEIISLQSVIRYLKQENEGLRVPVGEMALHASRNAWLHADLTGKRSGSRGVAKSRLAVKKEGEDVLDSLIDLARDLKPIRPRFNAGRVSDATNTSSRYSTARQREDLTEWVDWKRDVLKRARVEMRGPAPRASASGAQGVRSGATSHLILDRAHDGLLLEKGADGGATGGKRVRIVETSS